MNTIKSIYDNNGETIDRYTVVLNEKQGSLYVCLGLSSNPDSPNGFSQYSTCMLGNHLGKKIPLESLPKNIQQHIKGRI